VLLARRVALVMVALGLCAPSVRADALDDALARACTPDPRLAATARAALDPEADTEDLRGLAQAGGVAVPSLRVWRGEAETPVADMAAWVDRDPRTRVGNRCALARANGRTAVVHAPQVVELTRAPDGTVTAVALPAQARRPVLSQLTAEGTVTTRAIPADGSLPTGLTSPGTYQIVATLPEGPTPLALWSVGPALALPLDPTVTDPTAVVRGLNALRRAAGVPALRPDPLLARLARTRALALAAWGAPAHATAPDDDPISRLARAGLTAELLGENVALARSLAHAHARLLASPSHRATALDARLDTVGVGVAPREGGVALVVVLARHPGLRSP